MKGMELARLFYERYGKPMLEEQFPELLPHVAVGFVGSGSERYGFDDVISRDHDFEVGFSIFLPDENIVDRRQAFLLERAYSKLPKEFEGITRNWLSPVGGSRNGPVRMAEFYESKVGAGDGVLSAEQWLTVPDYALAEATNGEVFFDGDGAFTRIRETLLHMPEDVRKKRLAGNLLLMAQSGQYNYTRCIQRVEYEAAQMAAYEFVQAAIKVLFLLARRYAPYYKWAFHALREWEEPAILDDLAFILQAPSQEQTVIEQKYDAMEAICARVIGRLQEQELTKAVCGDMEKHAYSVNDAIAQGEIRNLHILVSV